MVDVSPKVLHVVPSPWLLQMGVLLRLLISVRMVCVSRIRPPAPYRMDVLLALRTDVPKPMTPAKSMLPHVPLLLPLVPSHVQMVRVPQVEMSYSVRPSMAAPSLPHIDVRMVLVNPTRLLMQTSPVSPPMNCARLS